MSTNNSLLPKEVVALVQHIELNKTGWWDKAIQRLVIAAVWLADEPPSAGAIHATLKTTFRLSLTTPKFMSALASLESRKMLLHLPSDTYRVPEEHRVAFEKEIAAAEKVECEAKESFCKLVSAVGEGLEPGKVWTAFEHEFLGPLIKQIGVNAYRLVVGEKMSVDPTLVDHFLKPFPQELHTKLRNLVTSVIDPKRPEICAHISRMLHARFCVEASGLPDDVLVKLYASVGKPIRFIMFVDTNFLFSLLELHENPSNAAAQELRELIAQLKGNPRIDLVITPETVDEAKGSIQYTKDQLKSLPAGHNFTQAALQARFSGMAVRFLTERLHRNGKLTVEEWFDPYLNDFVVMTHSKGVELFNEKLDGYSTRQDVIDDIHVVFKYEEKLPEAKRKSYPKVAHDMVLWHFANDKRPAYVESPIDANYWILTVDFRFIGFDEHKQKHSKSKIPLCIHPTSLIQLLQFWVPRTKEFEEAMLGSLRLPFLFQDFDAEGEKTSLKILKGVGRFEGSEGLSHTTITQVVLNDGLRTRLQGGHPEDAEISFIRDALVEEMKLVAETESHKARTLQEEILRRDSAHAVLTAQKQAAEQENAKIKKQKEESEVAAGQALSSQGAELGTVKARLMAMEAAELRRADKEKEEQSVREGRKAFHTYLSWLVFVISLSTLSAWQVTDLCPGCTQILGSIPTIGLAAIITFVLGHGALELSICRRPSIAALWQFCQVKRFTRVLWAVVIVGFCVGVGGNIYANWVQRNMDAEKFSLPEKEVRDSDPVLPPVEKK